MMRAILMTAVLAFAAAPLAAQEPAPPRERLEQVRIQRMKEALELTDEQAASVAQAMEEVERAMRDSRTREREALEQLRTALRAEPTDQNALRESIAAIEREREAIATARRQETDRLRQQLNVEQQAKLMLFTRQFDDRLRQLVGQRRGGPGVGRPGMAPGQGRGRQGMAPGQGPRANRAPGMVPGAPGVRRQELTREQQVERLQQRVTELQQRITELESQPQ